MSPPAQQRPSAEDETSGTNVTQIGAGSSIGANLDQTEASPDIDNVADGTDASVQSDGAMVGIAETLTTLQPSERVRKRTIFHENLQGIEAALARGVTHVSVRAALKRMGLLGVASAASQALATVQTPRERELSLNLLQCVIAESGESKTGVAHVVTQALREHDAGRATTYQSAVGDYRAQLARWQAIHRGLHCRLTTLTRDNQPIGEAAAAVEQHERCKPVAPRLRQTIRKNISERALFDALAGDCESIFLLADEGGLLLQNSLLTHPASLCSIWDGMPISLDRADGTKTTATHPCVSMLLMPQPTAMRKYLDRYGNDAVDTGLLSRCFLSYPASTQGTCFIDSTKPVHEQLDKFNAHIAKLQAEYDRQIMSGEVKRRKMHLSKAAAAEWYRVHNYFEGTIKTTDYGYLGRSFIRKGSEHVARMAGIFHFFDGQDCDVSVEAIKRAIQIVIYHAGQFVRLTSALSDPALLQSQVNRLVLYLKAHVWDKGQLGIPKTQLMHAGPWSLRSKAALDRVLPILIERQYVWLAPDNAKRLCVWLNGSMFQSFFAMYGEL